MNYGTQISGDEPDLGQTNTDDGDSVEDVPDKRHLTYKIWLKKLKDCNGDEPPKDGRGNPSIPGDNRDHQEIFEVFEASSGIILGPSTEIKPVTWIPSCLQGAVNLTGQGLAKLPGKAVNLAGKGLAKLAGKAVNLAGKGLAKLAGKDAEVYPCWDIRNNQNRTPANERQLNLFLERILLELGQEAVDLADQGLAKLFGKAVNLAGQLLAKLFGKVVNLAGQGLAKLPGKAVNLAGQLLAKLFGKSKGHQPQGVPNTPSS